RSRWHWSATAASAWMKTSTRHWLMVASSRRKSSNPCFLTPWGRTDMTTATSPLNEHGQADQTGLAVRERPFRGHLNLRGQPDAPAFMQAVKAAAGLDLPLAPNTVA